MTENRQQTDHDRVQRMVELTADRDTVWAAIGAFDSIAGWHPLIASAELTEIEGETFRHLTTTDDELFFERLIETGPHYMTYGMVEGPLPISDYRATLSCIAEDTGCRVFWSAYFTPAEEDGRISDEIVGTFHEIGLRALRERFT